VSRLRPAEWLILGYFWYVALLAGFYFSPAKAFLLAAAVAVVLVIQSGTKSILREFTPIAFTLAAYREMEWFAPVRNDGHLEKLWIVWDRRLLDDLHLRTALESAGALLPSYFELCYFLVYGVAPVAIAILFVYHRRAGMPIFWLAYLAGTLGVYALFPFFPSEPPRIAFHDSDLPHVITVLRRLNLWILGGYGIHSSVFPSAHVSSAFSAAWGLRAAIPERPWVARAFVIYGISVALATVYGRYHYAVDGVAGFVVSFLAVLALRLFRAPALPPPSPPARSA
jgi:membrane-associated phospholipid phosphatase